MTGNDEIVRSVAEETRSISLGTRRLVSTTSGHGSPVVVLESGLGAESAEWGAVQRGLSVHTRVCRYDRAGRGASDPAEPLPRLINRIKPLRIHFRSLPGSRRRRLLWR